jgi:hypothetical protein
MKLVALYKTWDGGEFVDASLASIYPHVDAIVMVHSEFSWLGEFGNTVRPLAMEWCQQHDKAGKVHHVNVDCPNQEAQYAAGIDFIDRYKLGDVVMVVDADEIWEAVYIENAKRQIADHPYPAYRSNMHTYLKTPFYRVTPPYGSPTVFLREPKFLTQSPRAHRAPAKQLSDVWMHHYTYVRESREAVERKLHQSASADGGEVVVQNWMTDVYDKLPEGHALHAFCRWRAVWNRIEKITYSDMPPAIRTAKLLPLWFPLVSLGDQLLEGEMNAIQRLASGRELAIDLGTYRGLSAVALSLVCRRVHTIDCYRDLPADYHSDTLEPKRWDAWTHTLEENQRLFERFGNITCEAGLTADAARTWNRGPVDVLFVDADHCKDGTLLNVYHWRRHMPCGGLIILHDNTEINPGVMEAVRQLEADPVMKRVDPGPYSGSLAAFEVVQ